MGFFDKFKGKSQDKKKPFSSPAKQENQSKEDVLPARQAGKAGGNMVKDEKQVKKTPVKLKEDTKRAHRVLDSYHLSEKSTMLANQGRYVFKVPTKTNKIEVRKAVQAVYGVNVVGVNMVSVKGKQRRMGRKLGRTSDWKKAIVTLKSGEKISGLSEGV